MLELQPNNLLVEAVEVPVAAAIVVAVAVAVPVTVPLALAEAVPVAVAVAVAVASVLPLLHCCDCGKDCKIGDFSSDDLCHKFLFDAFCCGSSVSIW